MRGIICRVVRPEWIAGLGLVLALLPAARAVSLTTTSTTLSAQTITQSCPTSGLTTTLTTLTVTVTASGSVPSGTVSITDQTSPTATPAQIASATLNSSGQATVPLYLANGSHTLLAVYPTNSTYSTSTSLPASATISSQCTTSFAVSLSNITPSGSSSSGMTVTAGESGLATVTITPSQEFVASLSTSGAPAFITASCSGLPGLASCTFTPEDLEILPGQDAGVISAMTILTQGQGTSGAMAPSSRPGHNQNRIAWAVLLPGMLGLGGLAWGARRRAWLSRLALLALVGLVTTLGTTACSPLYYYYNHGPPTTPATPSGTYNVTVTAQENNGITAISSSTTLVLTIN